MEELQNVPFLILGNKVDIGTAASEQELRDCLGLTHLTTGTAAALPTKGSFLPARVRTLAHPRVHAHARRNRLLACPPCTGACMLARL